MEGLIYLAAILFIVIFVIAWYFESGASSDSEDSEYVENLPEEYKTQKEFFYGRKKFGNANGYDRCGMTIVKNKI